MDRESIVQQTSSIAHSARPCADDRRTKFVLEFPSTFQVNRTPDYLIKGWLPSRGLVVLYGKPGAGKSFVAVDAALHVAAGRPWATCKVRQAGVIYVASEAGGGLRKRVIAAMRHHGFDAKLPFALVTVAPDLGSRQGETEQLAMEIRRQVPSEFDPGLIILDTLARSMASGDETGAGGMGAFVENAEHLSRALNATVMPIHHMGKDSERGMRGSSALLGAADAVWEIDPTVPERINLIKMKEAEGGLKLDFSLRQFSLGMDDDGDPITTCVVSVKPAIEDKPAASAANDASAGEPVLPSSSLAFAAALRSVLERHGAPARRVRLIPSDVKVLKQADLIIYAAELSPKGTTDKSRRSIIATNVRVLEQHGMLHRHKGYVWLSAPTPITVFEEKSLGA